MRQAVVFWAFGAGAAITLAGAGTAIAAPTGVDGVVGQPYADASSALSEAGLTPVVGVVVGGRLPTDECIVTSAQSVSAVREGLIDTTTVVDEEVAAFAPAEDEVVVSLNCNGGYATATNPGNSLLSPAGREARAAAEQAAGAEEQELEGVSTPDE
jgi:hypothetical protein